MKTIQYNGKEYPVREIAEDKVSTTDLENAFFDSPDYTGTSFTGEAETIDNMFVGYVSAEEINLPEKELFLLLEKYGIL